MIDRTVVTSSAYSSVSEDVIVVSPALRQKVVAYLDGTITLAELESWYVPRVPQFFKDPDLADADVVAAIDLGLAEPDDGIRSEAGVRELLAEALQEHTPARIREKERSDYSTEDKPPS